MRQFLRSLENLRRRVDLLINRVVISRVDDGKKMQSLDGEILVGEKRTEMERFQNYGFTSRPIEGAEGVLARAAVQDS